VKVPNQPGILAAIGGECWAARVADGILSVIYSVDSGRRHASIAHTSRYPTWDEIKEVRYSFFPDDCMVAMPLPPRSDYVNLHPNCFHLYEMVDDKHGDLIQKG